MGILWRTGWGSFKRMFTLAAEGAPIPGLCVKIIDLWVFRPYKKYGLCQAQKFTFPWLSAGPVARVRLVPARGCPSACRRQYLSAVLLKSGVFALTSGFVFSLTSWSEMFPFVSCQLIHSFKGLWNVCTAFFIALHVKFWDLSFAVLSEPVPTVFQFPLNSLSPVVVSSQDCL